jgi:hypothetical protein
MTTQNNGPFPLTAGVDIGAFLRVKLSGSRTVALAGANDYGIGVNQQAVSADERCTIRGDAEGTSKMVASAAITSGNKVYAAAGGKVAASGTKLIGTALDTATGNNSVIEVLPQFGGVVQSSSSSSSSSS